MIDLLKAYILDFKLLQETRFGVPQPRPPASALFSGLAASSERRGGSFAEFGAINAGHAA
jgi:hypothetical protein